MNNIKTLYPLLYLILLFIIYYSLKYIPFNELGVPIDMHQLAKNYIIGFLFIIFCTLFLYTFNKYTNNIAGNIILKKSKELYIATLIIVFIIFLIMILSKYYSFRYYADMANNLEILWRLKIGKDLTSPMFFAAGHKGIHWFSAHFSPFAYIIVFPFFYLLPFPETIVVLELSVILSGSLAISLIAKENFKKQTSYLFGCLFLFYPTIQYILLYDFGFLQFSIGFICWTLYFYIKQKYVLYIIFLLFSLSCREEVGLTLGLFGLYIIFVNKNFFLGFLTTILSLGYSLLSFLYVIPLYQLQDQFLKIGHYSRFGTNLNEIFFTILSHPISIFIEELTLIKIVNFIMIFMPFCFLSFLSISVMAISSINFGYLFLSDSISAFSYFLYYFSPSIPFIFYALIRGIKNKIMNDKIDKVILFLFIWIIFVNVFFSPSPISASFWNKDYKLGNFYTTNFHKSIYEIDDHDKIVHEAIKIIPPHSIIIASMPILPLLYRHNEIYIFTGKSNKSFNMNVDPDYIIVDWRHPIKTGYKEKPEYYKNQLNIDINLLKIFNKDDVIVYEIIK